MRCGGLILLLTLLPLTTVANVHIFITAEEMNRTIGMSKRLTYVRGGVTNDYALQFPFMIRDDIDEPIDYAISVTVSDPIAVSALPLISPQGRMSPQTTLVAIALHCTGLRRGEFIARIHLNYTFPSREHPSAINLTRRKICKLHKGVHHVRPPTEAPFEHLAFPSPLPTNPPLLTEPASRQARKTSASNLFYAASASVCLFVLAIVAFITTYFTRTKRRYDGVHEGEKEEKGGGGTTFPPASPPHLLDGDNNSSGVYSAIGALSTRAPHPSPAPTSSLYAKHVSSQCAESIIDHMLYDEKRDRTFTSWESARRVGDLEQIVERLTVRRRGEGVKEDDDVVELRGAFGSIVHCRRGGSPATRLLGKTIDRQRVSEAQMAKFYGDALSIYHAHNCDAAQHHVCIVQVIEGEEGTVRLLYGARGCVNLKRYLLGHKRGTNNPSFRLPSSSPSTNQLVQFSLHIATALQYLHSHKILHLDVAARNCVVSGEEKVLLCDCALAADLFSDDYACLGDGVNRPVKWMALEALHHVHSSASDVWSLGVTLWEVITCARQPYEDVEEEEMYTFLSEGYRLPHPPGCPHQLYTLMLACWLPHPLARPSATTFANILNTFGRQIASFV